MSWRFSGDPAPRFWLARAKFVEMLRRTRVAPRPAGVKAGAAGDVCGVSYEEGEALWEGWSVTV